jgi:hypothetical protein
VKIERHDWLGAWRRLAAVARRHRPRSDNDDYSDEAPPGFATRIVALAMAKNNWVRVMMLERIAFRALGTAALLACLSVAANYRDLSEQMNRVVAVEPEMELLSVDDPIAVVLDFESDADR